MSPLTSRKFTETDKEELNDSYNQYTGRTRSIKQFEWEWLNTPEGWGSMWILEDSETHRVFGHHGLIPIKFNYRGISFLAGKTENTFIHPPYAGKGVYYPFEVKFIEEARERFTLLYTTQGRGAPGRIRLKLGYTFAGKYGHYIKAGSKRHLDDLIGMIIREKVRNKFLAGILIPFSWMVSLILVPGFERKGRLDNTIKVKKVTDVETIADSLDVFWEQNKNKLGITADRNSQYIKWRIFENPSVSYDFLLAARDHEVVGYAITNSRAQHFGQMGRIIDIIAKNNDPMIFNTILDAAVTGLHENGMTVVQFKTILSANLLNQLIRRNGFISFSWFISAFMKATGKGDGISSLMAKSLSDKISQVVVSDPSAWYYTEILEEGRG